MFLFLLHDLFESTHKIEIGHDANYYALRVFFLRIRIYIPIEIIAARVTVTVYYLKRTIQNRPSCKSLTD
jgi:hypothetical protein